MLLFHALFVNEMLLEVNYRLLCHSSIVNEITRAVARVKIDWALQIVKGSPALLNNRCTIGPLLS